jgi:glycosyltransferase involved in cell wall biosynthesis
VKVVLIHPPWEGSPSGGHQFNRRLIAAARQRGYPLESRPLPPGASAAAVACPPGSLALWDSLFLDCLARQAPAGAAAHGLLAHYLPFANPLLTSRERREWERRCDAAVGRMGFLLATGAGAARLLERRYPGKPVFLCEPGVDPAFAAARQVIPAPAAGRPVRVATVANLLPAKGHDALLTALASIDPIWEWHLFGDEGLEPAYTAALWAKATGSGLEGRIVRHGALDTPRLAQWLGRMDLYASASRYEAYGMALAEAAAAGLPGVTTAVGEAEKLVRDGETGFVVPVDEPGRFRADLSRLVADAALRRRFRARLLVEPVRGWDEAFGDFERSLRERRVQRTRQSSE